MTSPHDTTRATREQFRRLRAHGAPGLALAQRLAGNDELEVSAQGAEVRLSSGRNVLDFGSYAVTLLGHRHPAIVETVTAQLATLPTSTRTLANEPVASLLDALTDIVGGPRLGRCWLGLNGSDAVEAALKLARLATGRLRVLALDGGFHGKSLGALSVTHHPRYRAGLEPLLSGVTHIPHDEKALLTELAAGDVAALIVEPIQGENGVRAVDTRFLVAAAKHLRQAGAFLISDEIQVGLRRCGPMCLIRSLGVEPDAILVGKPLGGGIMPLAAVICSDAMYKPLLRDPFIHTSTFSGHPLAAAAGVVALATINSLAETGDQIAGRIEGLLSVTVSRHSTVLRGYRGRGLLWGLECTSPAAAGWLLSELGPRGLLLSPCLSDPTTIRLLPPIVSSAEQLARAGAILDAACEHTAIEMARAGSEVATDVRP